MIIEISCLDLADCIKNISCYSQYVAAERQNTCKNLWCGIIQNIERNKTDVFRFNKFLVYIVRTLRKLASNLVIYRDFCRIVRKLYLARSKYKWSAWNVPHFPHCFFQLRKSKLFVDMQRMPFAQISIFSKSLHLFRLLLLSLNSRIYQIIITTHCGHLILRA